MSLLIRNLLFPPVCVGCRVLLKVPDYRREAPVFCPACAEKWRQETEEVCGICLRPVGECLCVTDAMQAAHIPLFRKLAYYRHGVREPVQNRMIYRIKAARDRRTVAAFADEMAKCVPELLALTGWNAGSCALVWLPRGEENRLKTGTDQARELAEAISARTGIPAVGLMERLPGGSREQKALGAAERKRNAAASFRLSGRVSLPLSAHLILVDDIVTTGASMAAAAKLLRRAKFEAPVALAALSDDANRTGNEKQPVIDLKSEGNSYADRRSGTT